MNQLSANPYSRLKWASLGAAVALALVGLTWLITGAIKSPQDVLASTAPPPPSQISVPIEYRVLDTTVTVTGKPVTPTRVVGTIGVDQRDQTEGAKVLVRAAQGPIHAQLTSLAPDGEFTLHLDRALKSRPPLVEVVFAPARPRSQQLVVPVTALFTSGTGQVAVVVLDDGHEREVPVRMGDVVGGFAAIEPAGTQQLSDRDEVLVSEPSS